MIAAAMHKTGAQCMPLARLIFKQTPVMLNYI